jgi:hypothetical protein
MQLAEDFDTFCPDRVSSEWSPVQRILSNEWKSWQDNFRMMVENGSNTTSACAMEGRKNNG